MVNKKFWLGILVMILVFGMMIVGCDNGSTNGNGNGGGGGTNPGENPGSGSGGSGTPNYYTNGRLTITNLSDYDGKYINVLYVVGGSLISYRNEPPGVPTDILKCNGGLISGDSVIIKVWRSIYTNWNHDDSYNYNGNDTDLIGIYIYETDEWSGIQPIVSRYQVLVTFNNGIGSVAFQPN
jgi:hypothetical protein